MLKVVDWTLILVRRGKVHYRPNTSTRKKSGSIFVSLFVKYIPPHPTIPSPALERLTTRKRARHEIQATPEHWDQPTHELN